MARSQDRPLRSIGACIYRIARNSIHRRKAPALHSKAGKYPYTHSANGGLKRSIQFQVQNTSVVVDPTRSGTGIVEKTHEFGGYEPRTAKQRRRRSVYWKLVVGGFGPIHVTNDRITFAKLRTPDMVRRSLNLGIQSLIAMSMERKDAVRIRESLRRDPEQSRSRSVAYYPERPFMGPALAITREKLPGFFRNSIQE